MRKIAKLLFLMCGLIVNFPSVADGLSQAQKEVFQSGIYYFDTEVSNSTCPSSGSTSSSPGGILPSKILSGINNLKDVYIQASTATGVPWQVLAAIHFREANNDPNRDLQAGNPIGGPYSKISTDYDKYGHPSSIEQSAEIAAKHLIATVGSGVINKPVNVIAPDPEGLKDALYSYNGRAEAYAQQAKDLGFNPATQPYEGSPYVMNNFDPLHMNMKIITRDFGPLDGVDTRLGAYTIYSKLGGDSGLSGTCSPGAVSGNLIQTIINYAWPDYHPANYIEEKTAYKQAILQARNKGEYTGGDYDSEHIGIDCGAFVTRVMRDSGTDPNYNSGNGNTIIQQQYLDEQVAAGKYIKLANVNGTTDLQPGDIAINSVHTYIYIGNQPGFNGNSASASFSEKGTSWRAPMADNASGFGGEFSWYRLKVGG